MAEGEEKQEIAARPEQTQAGTEQKSKSLIKISRKYKWILVGSLVSILLEGLLIYAAYCEALDVAVWQIGLWGIGLILALYAIVKKSIAAFLLNILLVFGISFIPAYQTGYEFFKPVIRLFVDVP